jgi:hypothetical protein
VRFGDQSYGDNKLEIMGQISRLEIGLFGKMRRVCQMQKRFDINYSQTIPETMPYYLSIDGENYVLRSPSKVIVSAAKQITILRGPNQSLK